MIHIVTGKDMDAVEAFIKSIQTRSSVVFYKMVPDRHHTELPEYIASIINEYKHIIIHTFSDEILRLIYVLAKPRGKPARVELSFDDIRLTRVTVRDGKTYFTELDGKEFAIAVRNEIEVR